MHHPAHIDGCDLVILRHSQGLVTSHFEIVAAGVLEYDGEMLTLRSADGHVRVVTDAERERILTVNAENRVPECHAFDLFILEE